MFLVVPSDDNLGTGIRYPDPTGLGTGKILYPWVAPIVNPNLYNYFAGIFSYPQLTPVKIKN
jgi:hypothetical protein